MPRPHRTSRTRTGFSTLNELQARSLLRSTLWDKPMGVWPSDDVRRTVWDMYRDTLLQYWVQDSPDFNIPRCLASANVYGSENCDLTPAGPLHRPRAWWDFEAPPRLCADCGLSVPLRGSWGRQSQCKCECEGSLRESMAAYLQRTGCLLDGEEPATADLVPEFCETVAAGPCINGELVTRRARQVVSGSWRLEEVARRQCSWTEYREAHRSESRTNFAAGIRPEGSA